MELLQVFHDSTFRALERPEIFKRRNEVIGWMGFHGTSHPITGVVVGRELREIRVDEIGEIQATIQTYVQVTGNEYILNSLPKSQPQKEGWSGNEVVLTQYLSLEEVMKLRYSGVSQISLTPGEPCIIASVQTSLPLAA